MKYDIITIGGATEDITFYTKEGVLIDNKKDVLRQKLLAFEYGAKLKIDKAYSTFGGGAANTAVCFSRLGLRVASLISVGHDERGRRIIKNLKRQRVNTRLVQKVRGAESGFSFLLVGPDNEHIVFSDRAANSKLKINKSDQKNIKNSKWLYITSLSGQWLEILGKIFNTNHKKITWNPGHIQLNSGIKKLSKFFKKTKVLIINKDEAIELVVSDPKYKNKNNKFLNKVKNLLTTLHGWGPEIVVITSGRKGADAYNGSALYHVEVAKERKRVDTTGVGDSFGSSFIAGLGLYNGNIIKAMQLGAKNSASVVSQQGAQNGLLSKKDI